MPTTTTTTTTAAPIFHVIPWNQVTVRERLGEFGPGPSTPTQYLFCDQLRTVASPEIDQATLSYQYGRILQFFARDYADYEPVDLRGKFVRVEILTTPEPVRWYGFVEVEQREPGGTNLGKQRFTAYGLLRIFERTLITKSWILHGTELLEIGRGLPINVDPAGEFPSRGNRSATQIDGTYVFSDAPRDAGNWNAKTAVEYFLAKHPPKDWQGIAIASCQLRGETEALLWYDVSIPSTDRMNLKEVLDQLIPRRRGVGYYIDYDEDVNEIRVNVFSFFRDAITLNGVAVPPNPNSGALDLERAFDVEDCELSNLETAHFDQVVVEGALQSSTITLSCDPDRNQLERDWSSAAELEYLAGASADPAYATAELEERYRLNAISRMAPHLEHVWMRFRIKRDWDQTSSDPEGPVPPLATFRVAPLTDGNGSPIFDYDGGQALWNRGIRILSTLPSFEHDEQDHTPEYRRPFAFVKYQDRWIRLDVLAILGTGTEEDLPRFGLSLSFPKREASIQFNAQGKPPHFAGREDWRTANPRPAETDPIDDPTSLGIDWRDLFVTLAIELDERVRVVEKLRQPDDMVPVRELVIVLPDARLDWIVPSTVQEIENGELVLASVAPSDWLPLRDDRPRMKDIARVAAEWYGRPRQALRLVNRQISRQLNLGQLITDFGTHQISDVNSPVTGITWDLLGKKTHYETSYGSLDFI